MLSLDFSCTQRFISTAKYINSDIQNRNTLDSRIYALFASIFFLLDTTMHLFAGTYKSFMGITSLLSDNSSTNYCKEAYHHFTQVLRFFPFIFIGSPLGFLQPIALQSEKLRVYLNWKSTLVRNQGSQSDFPEFKSLENSSLRTFSRTPPPKRELFLSSDTRSYSVESLSSQEEYYDASSELEKEQELQEEISKLRNLLAKEKMRNSSANTIFSSLKDRHPYNQILMMKKITEKHFSSAPSIFACISDLVKEEINGLFMQKFKMSFLDFCNSETPDTTSASHILTELLTKNSFMSCTNPIESIISKAIDFL